jgi:hypothetical protein
LSRLSGTLARWGRGTSTPLIERLPAPIGGWPRCLPRPDHQCVALRRGQWRSLEALQMPEHSDAILADAPPGVPRAGECGAPSLGRPADLVSGDPPRPRPRRAWPPAEPCDGRRGSATAPRFLEEHASVLELRFGAPIPETPPSADLLPVPVRRSTKHSTSNRVSSELLLATLL